MYECFYPDRLPFCLRMLSFQLFLSHMDIKNIEHYLPSKLINLLIEKEIKKVALVWLEKSGVSVFRNLIKNINLFSKNDIEVVYQGSLKKLSFYKDEIKEQNNVDSHGQKVPPELNKILKAHIGPNFALIIVDDMIDSGITTEAVRRMIREIFENITLVFYVMFDKISQRRKWTPRNGQNEFYIWGYNKITDSFLGGYGSNFWDESMRKVGCIIGCHPLVYNVLKQPKNKNKDPYREQREQIVFFLLEYDKFIKKKMPIVL